MKPKGTILITIPDYYSDELKSKLNSIIEDTVEQFIDKLPIPKKIIEIVCSYFKISLPRILDDSRERDIIYKRQVLHYFLYHYTELTAAHIGTIGKPYYSAETVRHSSRTISHEKYLEHVNNDINNIRQLIKDGQN